MISNSNLPPLPDCLKVGHDDIIPDRLQATVTQAEPIYENVEVIKSENRKCRRNVNHTDSKTAQLSDSLTDNTIMENSTRKSSTALSRLTDQMTKLRALDVSLLQQLSSLHDSIIQHKALLNERQLDETNSEYSYASIDRDLDSISSMDEFDYFTDDILQDSPCVHNPVYENHVFCQINELHEKMQTELNI